MYPKIDIQPIKKESSVAAFDLISAPISGQTTPIYQNSLLVLVLRLKTRDQLISCLNDCSAILNDEKGFKDRLTKEFRNLLPNLSSLRVRTQIEKSYKFDYPNANDKDCELVLDLDSELKNQLIAHLIKNLDLCIQYNEFATEYMKKDLIYQNNEFIQKLLSLPFGFMKKEDASQNFSNVREMHKVLNEVELFKEESIDINYEIERNQNKLTLVEKLIDRYNDIYWIYEFDADDLLKLTPYQMIRSDVFVCNNLPLAVCLKISKDLEDEHLCIGICSKYNAKAEWSANFEVRKVLMRDLKYGSHKATNTAIGFLNNMFNDEWTNNFISIKSLTNVKNHYINPDNKIRLAIELKVYDIKETRKIFKKLFK